VHDEHSVPAADPDSPAALATRIAAGEARAEARLVELYGRVVAIILDRHTGGRPEAEDLYQETFQTALEKLRRSELREPAKLPGFLARIARNLAIEHYRKRARRRTEGDSGVLRVAVARGPGQLDVLLDSEWAALVRRLIEELDTSRDREILFRLYVAEEEKEKIAADLGLSSLQFNRVVHRARQRFKTLYEERLVAGTTGGAMIALLVTLCY
jgi:RNA polymerase sigma-70 factor (ECF subfamily)